MATYEVCRVEQLIEGRGRPVRAAGRYLAAFLVDGTVHVIDNVCLHVESPLDGGPVVDGRVICPWHGWTYDLATGELLTAFGPRPGLRVYPVAVEHGVVSIAIDDPAD
ncbi:MAG TPA: Rieske (2Fe-2S) protein [Acidimicrobiales bacterium]|nr:Rieske (2Fe-2S) protein [Acidimicrobiales bacterium]